MTLLGRIGPGAGILLFTIVCALPWGSGGDFRLVLPLLPYALIHVCVERWCRATPDWLVFLAGFLMDVVGQGPLGYWSFIYLCGYTMARSSTAGRQLGFFEGAPVFLVTIVCIGLMQWSVTSIYYLRSAEVLPHLLAAAITMFAYLVLLMLLPSAPKEPVRINSRLERGV